jgi:stearoyl-CoA desaturase (delta-9 desaturase)
VTTQDTSSGKPRPGVLRLWLDNDAVPQEGPNSGQADWLRIAPFLALHLGCLLVLLTGWSPVALVVCAALYAVRMFAITAFYHRYFSHRAFAAPRWVQFAFALLGNMAVQRGPLWWAAHHRKHHKFSDTERDVHSPHQHTFYWSHMGWFTTPEGFRTDLDQVRDFARFPELRFLDRFDVIGPVLLGVGLYCLGAWLEAVAPSLGTSAWQMVAWGFFVSTTILFHVTSLVNSAGHLTGSRRYATKDHSRNSLWLALLTFGEGWHNNHHHYPVSARQGFYWWEVDLSYYILRVMQVFGLVSNLRSVPAETRAMTADVAELEPEGDSRG